MVRLRIDKLMARRGITAYALSRGAEISYPSAYRLSRPGGRFGRPRCPQAGQGPGRRGCHGLVQPNVMCPPESRTGTIGHPSSTQADI